MLSRLAPQAPPVTGTLHGFLSQDGRQIVLAASAASAWSKQAIGAHLSKLTCELSWPSGNICVVPCTWPVVVQIGHAFSQLTGLRWVPDDRLRDWIAAESARRTAPLPELEPSWPPWLEPRGYQAEGARMIAAAGKFLLLDEQGTGKSIQAILGIEQRRRMDVKVFPLVVITPSREVADFWAREIGKWLPGWPEPVMYLDPGRERLLEDRNRVLITTYNTAMLDARDRNGPLARYAPAAVVLDEAQEIQSASAARTEAAERVTRHAVTVIEISGTLFTQDTGGSFAPLKVLDQLSWASKERYKDRFLLTRKTEYAEKVTGLNPLTEPEFRACLAGQMIRRTKRVLPELPPKQYSILRPEIPAEWQRAYNEMRDYMLATLPDGGGDLPVFDTLTKVTRLSQLASCAADVEWTEEYDERLDMMVRKPVVTLRPPSWKAETLMGIMAKATRPVAVYTSSRQLARITGEHYLKPAGYKTGYIIGPGDGVTPGTRKRDVAAFQAGELDAIVCTAKAGGVGITLTAADTVVFLQRDTRFDKSIQPEDRAHRFGQLAEAVHIVDVVAKGTFDERVRELIHEKGAKWAEFCRDRQFVADLLGGLALRP